MKITFEVEEDESRLAAFNDEHIAFLWWLCQKNPAPIQDEQAGRIAERIGREIIRRWMQKQSPPLWNHQGRHYYWSILSEHGSWLPVNGDQTPDNNKGGAK